MPDCPGTRFQYVIAPHDGHLHAATITEADGGIPSLEEMSSADMVEFMSALRHVERECWLLDTRGPQPALPFAPAKQAPPRKGSPKIKARRRG